MVSTSDCEHRINQEQNYQRKQKESSPRGLPCLLSAFFLEQNPQKIKETNRRQQRTRKFDLQASFAGVDRPIMKVVEILATGHLFGAEDDSAANVGDKQKPPFV